jgi:phosphoglycerate dehydrogenase-like enzyme
VTVLSSAAMAERVRAALPHLDLDFVSVGPEGVRGDPATATVAYFSGDLLADLGPPFAAAVDAATSLAWFQSFSAGVDHPWFQSLLARGLRLTTASGSAARPIAHTVVYYLLALTRQARRWEGAQRRRAWEPHDVVDLTGQRLCVVGLGPIGLEVARLGVALSMDVVGVRRRPTGDEPCPTYAFAELDGLLPGADHLVLAAPLTTETRGLLDRRRIELLPGHAIVVNVGRGGLVDEPALVGALAAGRIGGAGLDVFAEEPLPPDSPLWAMPNVIVTPHACGQTPANDERALQQFLDNLVRWVSGEPLLNEVSST